MKFRLVERFTSLASRDVHYDKHVVKGREFGDPKKYSIDQYEKDAEALQNLPVDHKEILGYVRKQKKDGREEFNNVKYNKNTGEYVSYTTDDEPRTITYFKRDYRRYMDQWPLEYHDELPAGK